MDDEVPFLPPSADEDAWENHLTQVLELLGADGSNGLTNTQLSALEDAVGTTLPFEVGLLLIMGIPDGSGWLDWRHDPVAKFAEWNAWVLSGLSFDVEHNGFWSTTFGAKPESLGEQLVSVRGAFETIPPLLPIYGHRAMPLTPALGCESSDGNPVLSVMQTDVIVYGEDLAEWLYKDFGEGFNVPLPLWSTPGERKFAFWTELTHG